MYEKLEIGSIRKLDIIAMLTLNSGKATLSMLSSSHPTPSNIYIYIYIYSYLPSYLKLFMIFDHCIACS